MSNDPNETFQQEARELLEALEQALLDLESKPDDRDLVDSAFRALHTIKGSGAMFGYDNIASFTHEFETAFDRVRKGDARPSSALIAVALRAKDYIHMLLADSSASTPEGDSILTALRSIVNEGSSAGVHSPAVAVAVASDNIKGWGLKFRFPADALASGANPALIIEELRSLGEATVSADSSGIPTLELIDPEVCYLSWDVTVITEKPREAIEDVFLFLRDEMELDIRPLTSEATSRSDSGALPRSDAHAVAPVQDSAAATGVRPKAEAGSTSMRVSAERLDELMDRVGELVIAQARLTQIANASNDGNLKTVAEELERLSSGLRDTTMGIRMVPIGTLFGRFRRLVHDLSEELGKQIEFVTTGEETELDKTVIERLADPLVHVIRNSIDHGIETTASRLQVGKQSRGTVQLSARHTGAEVAISITDDGRGLDPVRIRAKAEESGLIAPDTKIADAELYQFLFHPGFSTAREITSVSGRGVGMDVVKRTIESLRGSIDISTRQGQGTTVTLRLPLTLAIIDGMLVRVGTGRYTIPLSAVEECVELSAADDARSTGRNFLNIRGTLVPFLRLRELFRTNTPADPHQKVVIVSSGDSRIGLVVDQIIGNNQTVIKSLSKLHSDVQTFSGATILGDGTVALIMDIGHLVNFGQAIEERQRAAMARVA